MKLWCSVCNLEYEGELKDGSYFDEDARLFCYSPDAYGECPKCGLQTGRYPMEDHFGRSLLLDKIVVPEESKEAKG